MIRETDAAPRTGRGARPRVAIEVISAMALRADRPKYDAIALELGVTGQAISSRLISTGVRRRPTKEQIEDRNRRIITDAPTHNLDQLHRKYGLTKNFLAAVLRKESTACIRNPDPYRQRAEFELRLNREAVTRMVRFMTQSEAAYCLGMSPSWVTQQLAKAKAAARSSGNAQQPAAAGL